MPIINLNQQLKRLEIKDFEISNDIVFNFFDKLPSSERDNKLLKAIYIGVLALMEDRISSFLSKTSNELGTELESLKIIFEMKKELFYKSTIKGSLAEEEIADFLKEYFDNRKIKDIVSLTGNTAGALKKNKTGDIVCTVDGSNDNKIVIECKFDKSIKFGEPSSKDIFSKKLDTAWSQLIESQVNREAKTSIIVFDLSLIDNSILKQFDNIGYIPEIGFIVIIDSQKGNYTNLAIAYMLARDIVINSKIIDFDKDIFSILITRLIKDINDITSIKKLVENNIETNKEILKKLEKSILMLDFNQEYLNKFLKDGTLTKNDLLDFYMGEKVREKYLPIEREINGI